MSRYYISTFPNRTLCDVIDEARKCHETRNYSYLKGLLEEIQYLGNVMEAGLRDKKEVKDARETLKEAKEELNQIKAEIKALEKLKTQLKRD